MVRRISANAGVRASRVAWSSSRSSGEGRRDGFTAKVIGAAGEIAHYGRYWR